MGEQHYMMANALPFFSAASRTRSPTSSRILRIPLFSAPSIALASESLEERAVYAVLRHPIEVSINSGQTSMRSDPLSYTMRSDLSTVFWFLEENR
jgi:hypothetical protein